MQTMAKPTYSAVQTVRPLAISGFAAMITLVVMTGLPAMIAAILVFLTGFTLTVYRITK